MLVFQAKARYIAGVLALMVMLSMPSAALASSAQPAIPSSNWIEWVVAQVRQAIDVMVGVVLPDGGGQVEDPIAGP